MKIIRFKTCDDCPYKKEIMTFNDDWEPEYNWLCGKHKDRMIFSAIELRTIGTEIIPIWCTLKDE